MLPDALGRGALPAPAEGFVEGDQVGGRRTAALHQSVFGRVESTLRLKETEEVRLACGIQERRQLHRFLVGCHGVGERLSMLPALSRPRHARGLWQCRGAASRPEAYEGCARRPPKCVGQGATWGDWARPLSPAPGGCGTSDFFVCSHPRAHQHVPSTRLCHRDHDTCYRFQDTLAQIITIFYRAHMSSCAALPARWMPWSRHRDPHDTASTRDTTLLCPP